MKFRKNDVWNKDKIACDDEYDDEYDDEFKMKRCC